MMYSEELRNKRITPEEAVALVRPGDLVMSGSFGSEPVVFFRNLHKLDIGGADVELHCCTLSEPYPFIDMKEPGAKIDISSFFYYPITRRLNKEGRASYIPTDLSMAGRCLLDRKVPDLAVITVGPMDENGYFQLSTTMLIEYEVIQKAKTVVFEVNRNIPKLYGNNKVHMSKMDYFYEVELPLNTVPNSVYTDVDYAIADYAASLVKDGDTIQLGIGSVPDCMAASLKKRHDLGIHTEFFTSSMVELMKCGAVNNSKKNINRGKSVYAFTAGEKELYDFLDGNPQTEIHPVFYVNDPAVIASNDNMVSINTALEVDLTGQICSESIGSVQFSGTGGATDFAKGAFMSKGGRGIIAMHSTTKNGTVSKIKLQLSPGSAVSISRNIADCIVTEYGVARLRGASIRERAKQLIAIAHPDFREELTKQAKELFLF